MGTECELVGKTAHRADYLDHALSKHDTFLIGLKPDMKGKRYDQMTAQDIRYFRRMKIEVTDKASFFTPTTKKFRIFIFL